MNKHINDDKLWSIVGGALSRQEYGDLKVGDRFSSALDVWSFISIEVTRQRKKSMKEIELGLYDAVAQVRYYPNSEIIVLDCGIYVSVKKTPSLRGKANLS